MFSFEGNYRTTPEVSLGGRSKKTSSASSVTDVVAKARAERQKREAIRKQINSSIVVQSSFRSYVVRKRIKEEFRQLFDQQRKEVREELFHSAKLLCFFYEEKLAADSERLVLLCQRLLKDVSNYAHWSSTFLLARTLVLCCRTLLNEGIKQVATPLRMLEVYTGEKFWEPSAEDSPQKIENLLRFWKRLICNVPPDVEFTIPPPKFTPPHLQLAQSLVDILRQPLKLVAHTHARLPELADVTMHSLIADVASRPAPFIQNYIIPSLKASGEFPRSAFLTRLHNASSGDLPSKNIAPNVPLLAALSSLLSDFTDEEADLVLHCVAWLFPVSFPSDPGSESDSEDEIPMDIDDDGSLVNELVQTSSRFINSRHFIDKCLRKSFVSVEQISSIAAISYHLIAQLRQSVHTTRFLYTLSFSPRFLKSLWFSILNLKSDHRNSEKRQSSVQMLIFGRPMNSTTRNTLLAHLITFASLYSHNLLSLHDTDFFQTDSSSVYQNAFSIVEVIEVVKLLKEISLSVLKKIFPDWRAFDYDVREVFQRVSLGKSVRIHSLPRDNQTMKVESAALLFKVCSRLLNQLYTRHTRRPFNDDPRLWLSATTIEDDRTKYLSSNWRRRNRSDAIAAHMADPSDQDLPMSISEARQLTTLTCLPFTVPFQTRVAILTSMLSQDRQSRETSRDALLHDAGMSQRSNGVIQVKVRRDYIYEDAFNDLSTHNAPDLRRVLRVTFVNAAGAEEAGYGAGVTREFIQQLIRTAFDPSRALFKITAESELFPNPYVDQVVEDSSLHFNFLGRLVGKILYEGMQVELRFAAFFLCKLLRSRNADVDINHLQSLDPDFYKNLMFLRSYDGDVADLDVNFTVVDDKFGETNETELVPGGRNIAVTNENRLRYIHLLADYKLNTQMRAACDAFRRGLASVIPLEWLRMFDQRELQTLISGAEAAINVADLKKNAVYSGGYSAGHPTVDMFWSILDTFTEEQKRKLLLFVTSCSRPPLLGFKEMHPPFCVHHGGPSDRLPTSSTCLNLLRLPEYRDGITMKEKLLYCIDSQSGFELS